MEGTYADSFRVNKHRDSIREQSSTELKKIGAVGEAYIVYDILAKVKASAMDNLKEVITSHVRRLDKIQSTPTMIVIEERG